jgi:Fe2+ transport system protein FeoA
MRVKTLNNLNHGEKGKIIMVRGAASIHRYLYGLGLFVGRTIAIEKPVPVPLNRSVYVRINTGTFSLENEVAANIKVEIAS